MSLVQFTAFRPAGSYAHEHDLTILKWSDSHPSYVAHCSGELRRSCDKCRKCRAFWPIPALCEVPRRRTSTVLMTKRRRRVYDHRIKEQIVRSRDPNLFPESYPGSGGRGLLELYDRSLVAVAIPREKGPEDSTG
jgi:hypothetical protein